jgi:hypothetical protein
VATPPAPPAEQPGLQDRLVQLERLVMSLKQESAKKPDTALSAEPGGSDLAGLLHAGAPKDAPVDESSEYGSMRVSASELRYVGGDHWAAILDSIADLKDHFDREEDDLQTDSLSQPQDDYADESSNDRLAGYRSPHALLLYGCPRSASRAEIIASLPPKDAADRYISRYFNRLDLVASCWCTLLH